MDNQPKPGRYDLFLLTQAYNRERIIPEEWIARTSKDTDEHVAGQPTVPKWSNS